MASHHFLAKGPSSPEAHEGAAAPDGLAAVLAQIVRQHGFRVVSQHTALFDNGGLTLVSVLAESHMVLHVWRDERRATLDLHVCDFKTSNEKGARALMDALSAYCFAASGAVRHAEMHLAD